MGKALLAHVLGIEPLGSASDDCPDLVESSTRGSFTTTSLHESARRLIGPELHLDPYRIERCR